MLPIAARLLTAAFVVGVTASSSFASGLPSQAAPQTPAPTAPLPPVPLQDPPAITDQAPGSTALTVTLTDSFIRQRLPFDVPFYLAGTVADTTTSRLVLSVYQVLTRTVVSDVIADLQASSDCNPPKRTSLRVSQSASRVGANRSFSLLVEALEPNRYYVFCFLSAQPLPFSDIEKPVRDALVATMARFEKLVGGDISVPMAQSFHDDLAGRIDAIGALRPDRASIPVGNIFHKDLRVARGNPFALLLTSLLDPYSEMSAPKNRYDVARKELIKLQGAISTPPAKEFLTPALLTALSAAPPELPLRDTAITSTTPINAAPFNFDSSRGALLVAAEAARPKNADVAKALTEVANKLEELDDEAGLYVGFYERLRIAAQSAVTQAALEASQINVSLGSSVLSAELSRSAYVSLDAGIAYPWRLENMVFYAGTNIYFRPINKAAPLRYKGTFLHRFALTLGVTTTVKDDSRRALDLRPTANNTETSNSLLIGGGLRVTPSIRLGAGALVFKENDPNPLIKQTSVTVTPYVSLSADVDVAAVLKSFFPQ